MSVIVYSTKSFRLKSFINLVREKYIRAIALNAPPRSELAIFYDYEIILYDIHSSSTIRTYPLNFITFLQFNASNKLLALTSKGSISVIDINTQSITSPKLLNQTTLAKWYPFNSTEFIYCTASNEVCLCNCALQSKQANTHIKLDGYGDHHIVDISWYDIDENYKYALTAFNNGDIVLLDMNGVPSVINKFDRSGGGLVKVIWLLNEPGSFMSVGKNSTRVALYNVSRKNYKSIMKLADFPIVNCVCFDNNCTNNGNKVLLALDNGAVLIYDLVKYKSVFDVTPGHSETVFDLKFSPFINGCFATCAYDGFIKVWNMETNNVTLTLKVNDPGLAETSDKSRIYALKWSPLHKEHLLSGDSRSTVRIWDIAKQKQLAMHVIANSSGHKVEVIGIDWDKATNLIYASCYNVVHVLLFEGLKFNLMHAVVVGQGKLFQIKVSPHEPGAFAVSAMDSHIRVYSNANVAGNEYKQTKLLKGHTHKVFGIAFHPKENILASSSDDFKVGIWNVSESEPKAKYLLGHTSNVRQLVWIANSASKLLCSGSWDSTTRIWNVDYMICVSLINEHQSDVYGIDLNPFHPFLLGTSSRDNSIRFWNYLCRNPIDYVLVFSDYCNNKEMFNAFPALYEKCESVCSCKDKSQTEQAIDIGECVINFFYYVDSAKELFDILRVVLNIKQHSDENNKLFYLTDMYSAYKSKALNLEFKFFNEKKFDYHVKKEDLVKEALDYCMKCGDWEKFCELSVEIGNWKQAIMAAPHVSMAYWEDIVKRYNAGISSDNNNNSNSNGNALTCTEDDKLTSALLVKDIEPSVNALVNVNEYDSAILTWIYKAYRNTQKNSNSSKRGDSFFEDEYAFDDVDELLNENKDISELSKITYKIVHKYLTVGDSIKAASSLLSIKKVGECIKTLLRTNETELAFIIATITSNRIYEFDILLSLLSQQIKGNTYSLSRCMNIINASSNHNYKYLLYTFLHNCSSLKEPALTEYNNTYAKVTDINIHFLHNSNYDKLLSSLQSLQHVICEQLRQNTSINEEHIVQLLHLFDVTKVMNINAIQDKTVSTQMHRCVLYCGLLMEVLNHNSRSVLLLSNEIVNMKFNVNLSEDELFICGAAGKLHREVKNKELPLMKGNGIKEVGIDLSEVFKCVETFSNAYARKYYCDGDVNKFYFLKSETFPVNTKNICISKLRTKVIKGKAVHVNGGSYTISQSEGMEVQKVISRLSFMKNEETMLICY